MVVTHGCSIVVTHVLESGDKTFTYDISGRKVTISVDRLKLAHVDLDNLPTLPKIHQIWSTSQIATSLHLRSGGVV